MKNKKSTIGLMLLLAGSLVLTNCTKDKTNEAPTMDTDVSTSTEAITAQMILNDIHEIAGQVCETNAFLLGYHDGTPLSTVMGTTTINSSNAVVFADLVNEFFTVTFNNTVGKDGHVRNGVLKFDYAPTTTAAVDHYRQADFKCDVTATNYSVDDYTVNINSMRITNTTRLGFPNTGTITPANYNLTWTQASNVAITRLVGATTQTTSFNGTITKTLLNTNNTAIPMPTGNITYTVFPAPYTTALYLNKQYCQYSGNGTGTLANGSTYSLDITSPLTRNFVSSPEPFISYGGAIKSPEKHPFLTGTVSFKPAGKSERTIDFGPSGDIVDYNAKVTIDGVSYHVDIKQ